MPAPRGKVKIMPGARRPETAERSREKPTWSVDSPERIQKCLNCRRTDCKHGSCPEVEALPGNWGQAARRGGRGGRGHSLPEELERERMELYSQGLTDSEMEAKLGLKRTAIGNWRRSRGLPMNPRQMEAWKRSKKKSRP